MAKQLVAGVPSLHSISNPILTRKEDVAAYLIQFLFANPGSTSSVNEGEMMSFRKLVSLHGSSNTELLATKIAEMLTTSLQHYFPADGLMAGCSVEEEEGVGDDGVRLGNLGIVISIKDADGSAVMPMSKFSVAKDGSSFKMQA